MTTSPNPYRGFRFPAEVIEHAVWLYHCFSLSLRDVETIVAARGVIVSYDYKSNGARPDLFEGHLLCLPPPSGCGPAST